MRKLEEILSKPLFNDYEKVKETVRIVQEIENAKDRESIPDLYALLKRDHGYKADVLSALSGMGEEGVPKIIEFAEDEDSYCREVARFALGNIYKCKPYIEMKIIECLLKGTKDISYHVKKASFFSLGKINMAVKNVCADSYIIEYLKNIVDKEDEHLEIRNSAANALVNFKIIDSRFDLLEYQKGKEEGKARGTAFTFENYCDYLGKKEEMKNKDNTIFTLDEYLKGKKS
jgi:HEAT repeat protein